MASRVSIRPTWNHSWSVILIGQVVPCYLCWQYFICHLHHLFGPTRLRTGPSVVYNMWPILWWTFRHGVTLHSFADDTQLYLHCHCEDTIAAAAQLTDCVVNVSHWMTANRLKLNKDKTELLWTGSRHSCPSSRAWIQLCNWAQTLSQHATRSSCSGST